MNNGFSYSIIDLPEETDISVELNMLLHTLLIDADTDSKLSCFSFQFNSEATLAMAWQDVTNEIAVNYIAHLENGFSKWNCYIIFLCSSVISKELKYKIENNKFAVRKIVIDGLGETVSGGDLTKIINNRILDLNIELSKSIIKKNESLELSKVSQELLTKELPLDKKDESIKVRQEWINKELERIIANEN